MIIRQETTSDASAVYELVKTAFASAEHSDGNEQDLVVLLHKSPAFQPALSLVAEENGKIIGYILFSEIKIGEKTAIAPAPLAVLPEQQRKGVGLALLQEGHRIAKKLGYSISVVLGSETYYPKAGYVPASRFGIVCPFEGVPDENYMALPLQEPAGDWNGTVTYDKAFFEV